MSGGRADQGTAKNKTARRRRQADLEAARRQGAGDGRWNPGEAGTSQASQRGVRFFVFMAGSIRQENGGEEKARAIPHFFFARALKSFVKFRVEVVGIRLVSRRFLR
jgi:hypothetical protein